MHYIKTFISVITSNEETLNRLKAGDESVFDAVYKQYYKGLCAFASQYVAETETEEIVQEVMMWLWVNRINIPGKIKYPSG